MYKLVFVLLFTVVFANANSLSLVKGKIQAHTEVFGDSTINPQTENIVTELEKSDSLESIKGKFQIEAISLISDNKDRDKHMYEVLNVENSPKIVFILNSISKQEDSYLLSGILILNNISKPITSKATIKEVEKNINLNGDFSIKLTDFGMEPPTMFFLTVRDQIDIKYDFNFKDN